jgi:glycosyltransferase involved in cell wall biosynthesis
MKPRPRTRDDPLVVGGRTGHRLEVVGERVRHYWEDTAMRVCVLTTSYPRFAGDVAGVFVAEQVEHLRAAGVVVDVVSPASFPHFGIAYGGGIVQNLRARPSLVLALPLFLAAYVRAARRVARRADVVHAHWLPSGLVALATGKPFVLQVWGTDVELAQRAPRFARPIVARARVVIAASSFLAGQARRLGAREVRVIPNGVEVPETVAAPANPPHVLFVGRLSEEKGILEFLEATEGLPRVIVGDGPLRGRVSDAVGFVPHDRLGEYYERAAVVCVPSRREGYGVVAREAMAYGRPVVATRVGGLADALEDGVSGLALPPNPGRDVFRDAVATLLADAGLRVTLGARARELASTRYGWAQAVHGLVEAYEAAVSPEGELGTWELA